MKTARSKILGVTAIVLLCFAVIWQFASQEQHHTYSPYPVRLIGFEDRREGRYALFEIRNDTEYQVQFLVPSGADTWTGAEWRFRSPRSSWKGVTLQKSNVPPGATFSFFVPFPPTNTQWRPFVAYRPMGDGLQAFRHNALRRLRLTTDIRIDTPIFTP
jgi:hypothetical protein